MTDNALRFPIPDLKDLPLAEAAELSDYDLVLRVRQIIAHESNRLHNGEIPEHRREFWEELIERAKATVAACERKLYG